MSEDPNPRLKEISDEEWQKISLRLFRYAKYKCRLLPGHMEPADMSCEAIKLALTGERQWNTTAYPDVFDFLKGIIDSRWQNLWRKGEHENLTSEEIKLKKATDALSIEKHEVENQFGISTDSEVGHEIDRRLRQIAHVVEGDPNLEEFYLALEYGCSSIKEIASMLHWTLSKTYKVKAKLTSKVMEHQRTNEGGIK